MKFIIIQAPINDTDSVRELPIIFPNDLAHSEVAAALLRLDETRNGSVVSAGFVNSFDLNVTPSGKSTTLGNLCPRSRDQVLMQMVDYSQHITRKGYAEKRVIECKCGQKNKVSDGKKHKCGKCGEVL